MKHFLKICLSAAFLTVGAATAPGLAEEREVNNIWWGLLNDYNGTHQTACVAENYNSYTVEAVFDLFPTAMDDEDEDGGPPPTTVLTMKPYVTYKLFEKPDGAGADVHCALRSYTVHVP